MADNIPPHETISMPTKPKSALGRPLIWLFFGLLIMAGGSLWIVRAMLQEPSPQAPPQVSLPVENMEAVPSTPPPAQLGILDMLDGGKSEQAPQTVVEEESVVLEAEPLPVEEVEDSIVRHAFIDDLAPWLVSLYFPKGSHPDAQKGGAILADISRLNQRYGTHMTGLSWSGDSLYEGRAAVLDYIFTPSMIESVYALYADRFMQNMHNALTDKRADGLVLSTAQKKEMYSLYAQRLQQYAAALKGMTQAKDLSRRVKAWQDGTDRALDANALFSEKLFLYEAARDEGRTLDANEARIVMDTAAKAYQQSIIMRERARESLAESLRTSADARRLDEPSLLYLATWVQRRLDANPKSTDALQTVADVFKDLSRRFNEAAKGS